MNQALIDLLNFATFQALVKTRFCVEVAPTVMVELELIEAEITSERAQNRSSAPRHESFSLIFAGAAEDRLAQKTYRLRHEKIGLFDLFIVPIAAEGETIRYQAVFNRLIPPSPALSAPK